MTESGLFKHPLMDSWDLVEGRANAADKKGLSDEQLGWIFFPEVEGGKGKANGSVATLESNAVGCDN